MLDVWLWPDAALLVGVAGLVLIARSLAPSPLVLDGSSVPAPIAASALLLPAAVRAVASARWQPTAALRLLRQQLANGGWAAVAVSAACLAWCYALAYVGAAALVPVAGCGALFEASSGAGARRWGRALLGTLLVTAVLVFGLSAVSASVGDIFDRLAGSVLAVAAAGLSLWAHAATAAADEAAHHQHAQGRRGGAAGAVSAAAATYTLLFAAITSAGLWLVGRMGPSPASNTSGAAEADTASSADGTSPMLGAVLTLVCGVALVGPGAALAHHWWGQHRLASSSGTAWRLTPGTRVLVAQVVAVAGASVPMLRTHGPPWDARCLSAAAAAAVLAALEFAKDPRVLCRGMGPAGDDRPLLPHTHKRADDDDTDRSGTYSVYLHEAAVFFRRVAADPKQRRLAAFLALTAMFMVVELVAGVRAHSLGLVADALHMLLDTTSIAMGLWAAHMAGHWPRTARHPLGFGPYEVVSGFANGVLLVFVALYILCEAAERMVDPPTVDSAALPLVSSIGLLVNIIGVVFFHDSHSHGHSHGGGGDCPSCAHGAQDPNLRGVYLHILADLLGSLSVLASTAIVRITGWSAADPCCSALVACIILASAGPLLRDTATALLLRAPPHQLPRWPALEQALAARCPSLRRVEVVAWSASPNAPAVVSVRAEAGRDHNVHSSQEEALRAAVEAVLREGGVLEPRDLHAIEVRLHE